MLDKDDAPTPQSQPEKTGETLVRFMGRLVPARVVESLPASIRSLQLNNAMVYRFPSHRHQDLARFTFVTSAHILQHHRLAHRGEELVAPLLPDESAKTTQLVRPSGLSTQPEKKSKPNLALFGGGIALACLIIAGLTFALSGDETKAANNNEAAHPETADGQTPPAAREPQRSDFDADPLVAYQELLDRAVPSNDPILARVLQEINASITSQLDSIEQALASDDTETARSTLSSLQIPESVLFAAHQRRSNTLREELRNWVPHLFLNQTMKKPFLSRKLLNHKLQHHN